jgi:hypothetical protein
MACPYSEEERSKRDPKHCRNGRSKKKLPLGDNADSLQEGERRKR